MPDLAYDVFISYSSRDRSWVEAKLLPRLENYGLRVCLDKRDFDLGAPSVTEMERAVTTSRKTLLVLTPHYLKSVWTKYERLMLQTLDPANDERRLIPLLRTPCDLPLSINYLTYVDFTGDPQWDRLLSALGTPPSRKTPNDIPLDALPDPIALPPNSLMPLSRNPLFVGRERELRELARLLKGGATAAIDPQAATTDPLAATTGLGGIGKTQLASEFVHRYGQFFPGGVFWLSFENPDGVPAEIARCGGAGYLDIRPNFADLKLDDQVQLVLQAWQLALPRLLIFDNCEDEALLDRWRPRYGGCRVLVTSRRAEWSPALGVQALKLETLPRRESIELLRKHRPDLAPDDPDLDRLAEYLGDLPLALHVAGSFLARYQHDYDPAEYLAELAAAGGIDAELLEAEGVSPTQHDQNIIRTFELSYNKLDASKQTDALALRLLARAAYCAPGEPLPRDLLLIIADIDSEDKKTLRSSTRAINRLSALGLLEVEEASTLRLHRLLAAFVRAVSDDAEAQGDVEQNLFEIAARLNKNRDPRPLLAIQSQLRAVVDVARERLDVNAARLCNEVGVYLRMIGDYSGAKSYYEWALAVHEQVLGEQHPDTAASLNNLGYVLQAQGDLQGAKPYLERTLMICEQVLGTEHPNTAASLNNLGYLLQAQGDYARAQSYYERGLAINEQVLGVEHPDTARSLNNLGALLDSIGDYAGARSYFERALTIREQVLGVEHPDIAQSLNNLGALLDSMADLEGARPYYERALAIREQVLGAEHPDTASSLNNLGFLLQGLGDLEGARPYFEQALVICEQVLGANHPTTCIIRNNLAALDTPPQTVEQQIAEIEQQVTTVVEAALSEGSAEQRTELAAKIEALAQWAEKDEQEGSPYLALASRLRELAKQLEQSE